MYFCMYIFKYRYMFSCKLIFVYDVRMYCSVVLQNIYIGLHVAPFNYLLRVAHNNNIFV